ncbi:aqualysin-1-like [Ptychodera flava]|uniref:aqualysin-1-like n=1 Tax=Ptychodera flava TaxID=63121 RepID=UPI00396AA74A
MRIVLLALFVTAASAAKLAPYLQSKDAVQNRYFVKVKDEFQVSSVTAKLTRNFRILRKFTRVFHGFVVEHIGSINTLRGLPFVEYVEDDSIMTAHVEWGCDRIDQRNLPLDGRMDIYGTGSGAHVFIADTGIRYTHVEFGGRAHPFFDFESGRDGADCHGHGTHCGGTAVGETVGVAVDAQVHSVRVLNCQGSGFTSDIVAGLDAVAASGIQRGVVSMSLGGGASTAMDNGVKNVIAAGYPTAVSAGNSNANACNQSPARVEEADTVGSTDSFDRRSSFSNFGSCVDIFAAGTSVRSAYHTSDTAYATMSGTSMSCPHVAGAIAVHMGARLCHTGENCKAKLAADATNGVISNPGTGSPNLLLYVE